MSAAATAPRGTVGQATAGPVGLVGLGLVGTALAGRLAAAGIEVVGFDLRPEARSAFVGGPTVDALPALGCRVRVVVLAVFETRDVQEVLDGPGGLLGGGSRVDTVIDCSTGDPQQLAALAERLRDRAIAFVEAPLSGSSQQIAAGEATMLIGGDPQVVDRESALFDVLSPRRIRVGGPGAGANAKLATNLVLGLNRAVLAEGIVFAESLGIAPRDFVALVLATPARSAAAEVKGAMMAAGRFEDAQSRIRQHLKDVRLMVDRAGAGGQPLPLSAAHMALMSAAVEAGDGDLDNAGLIRQWRRLAGRLSAPPSTPEPPAEGPHA